MKRGLAIIFISFGSLVQGQSEITNSHFNFFDLMNIENNHFHQQIQLSASMDEIGWNGELYKVNKNFISCNFSASYKRLWPNIPPVWTPNTLQNIDIFPQNGLLLSFGGRWFFNQRKFAYAGAKITTGYLWVKDKDVVESITFSSTSDQHYHVFNVDNLRAGIDLIAGRKFVNKFISDITVEAGYRFDRSVIIYQYIPTSGVPVDFVDVVTSFQGFYHFQIRLGFDIFSK